MKICFLIGKFPSLSETFILNQITGLIDRGHDVDIYAIPPTDRERLVVHPDVEKYELLKNTYYRHLPSNKAFRLAKAVSLIIRNFHRSPLPILKSLNAYKLGKRAATLWMFYQIFPFLGRGPYDIIQCHFGHIGYLAVLAREIGAVSGKVVTTFHGVDIAAQLEQGPADYCQDLFENGELFLPISERWKDGLTKLGCDPNKINIHRMGIDTRKFSSARHEIDNQKKIIILTVARLVEKKGIEYGVRAVSKILRENPNVNIEYQIVGSGELETSLKQLVNDLNTNENIKFLGRKRQEDVIELMRHADIMLAPSVTSSEGDQEGIPVSLMEALAMRLPIVSTQHSGIPELVQEGKFGFLVPERDVDALADKLEYLIQNPALRQEMGKLGQAHVEEHYDIDKLNDRLVHLYQELLKQENQQERII